jgi:hypothetical protein
VTTEPIRVFSTTPHDFSWTVPPEPTISEILGSIEGYIGDSVELVTASCAMYYKNGLKHNINLHPKLVVENGFVKWAVEYEGANRLADIDITRPMRTDLRQVWVPSDESPYDVFTPFPDKAEALQVAIDAFQAAKENMERLLEEKVVYGKD